MDSRLAALQQVILKKDLAILDLQTQLDAYRARYGELDASAPVAETAPDDSINTVAAASSTASAASTVATTSQARARPRTASNGSGLPAWLTRGARATSFSPSAKSGRRGFNKTPVSSPIPATTAASARAEASLSRNNPVVNTIDTRVQPAQTGRDQDVEASTTAALPSAPATEPSSIAPAPAPVVSGVADLLSSSAASAGTDVSSATNDNMANPSGADGTASGPTTRTGKNVVLDFCEDSPTFRRHLEGFDDSLSGLRSLLRELQAHTKEYVSSGMKFGEEEAALADELVARKYARALFTTSCPELGSMSSVFNQVHDTLAQLQSSRVSMLLSVEALMHQAIESIGDQELKEGAELRKDVARLSDEYEAQLGKLLGKSRSSSNASTSSVSGTSTPSAPSSSSSAVAAFSAVDPLANLAILGSPALPSSGSGFNAMPPSAIDTSAVSSGSRHQRTLERDVLGARLRFELARFDLVRYLNRLDARKKIVLIECFNSTLYALLGHFHACHELVKAVEPALRERQENLQRAKQDVDDDDAMWAAQRVALEGILRGDLERLLVTNGLNSGSNTPNSSTADSGVTSSTSNASSGGANVTSGVSGGMPRTFDLPVEVLSRETWSSRQEEQQPGSAGNGDVVKQGYLFVRNSMFPARSWKRKWFHIHAGKLYQNRGRHMDLVLLCDLLLARVREAESTNLPYCFEVIDSSQAKHLLQATSEADMREWIDAAQKSTAAMLEKQSHRNVVHPEQQAAIDELVARNPVCADCGQAPAEWVSINIGCLLCIECSGIHRSLGVHESKVRSLTLDSWDMGLLVLLRDYLGNDSINASWEHTIPPGWTRPTAQTSREEKTKWITAKYHFHGFAEPMGEDDKSKREVEARFLAAAERGDLSGLVWGLAHGVDVNVRDGSNRQSALHLCAGAGSAMCCDYLVLNGASIVATDARGKTPNEVADDHGYASIKAALAQKVGGGEVSQSRESATVE